MLKLVTCFKLLRVFRWMNVEAFVRREETRREFLVLLGDEVAKRSWRCGMVGQKVRRESFRGGLKTNT